MACSEPRLTALKVAHKGEIHRLRVDLSTFGFEHLTALFAETFHLAPGAFVVQYTDAEGDVLNVTSEAEYVEACRVFLAGADAVKALRFQAVSRTQVAFQENVTEPILKAIEKLVETLTAAMEKVKQDEWTQRAQSGVEHTGVVLNRAAKDARESLCAAGKQIQEIPFDQMAKDARESLCAAGKKIQEMPFDQMLKETSDSLKATAESLGSFANEMVDDIREEIKKFHVAEAAAAAPATTEEVDEAPTAQPVAVDPEWEQVAPAVEVAVAVAEAEEAAATPVVVVPEPEIVEIAPTVTAEEQKWAAELSMVRDIFPNIETARVIDQLEQCNGNVAVVVNALMEEM